MTPGTPVRVVGDPQWNGSIWRGHTGTVVPRPANKAPEAGWVWVALTPPPPCTPARPLAFRIATLEAMTPRRLIVGDILSMPAIHDPFERSYEEYTE